METNNVLKISLQTLFIILLIIIIIVMGLSMHRLSNETINTNKELEGLQNQLNSLNGTTGNLQGLQNQVDSLNETIINLQGKIDSIQKTINSNNSDDNGTTEKKNNDQNSNNEIFVAFDIESSVAYEVITDKYSDYESQIISNYQQYLELVKHIDSQNKNYGKVYNFDSNKYDEQYFNTKSLAILNIVTGNRMNKLKSVNISIRGDTLICNADINYDAKSVLLDLNGVVLLAEIDKSVTKFEINK